MFGKLRNQSDIENISYYIKMLKLVDKMLTLVDKNTKKNLFFLRILCF